MVNKNSQNHLQKVKQECWETKGVIRTTERPSAIYA
jgi:hypothetical protein